MIFEDDTPHPNALPDIYPKNPPRNILSDSRLLFPSNLFAFEGLEGAGKSTLLTSVMEHLQRAGKHCLRANLSGSDIIPQATERAKWKNSDSYVYNLINWVSLFDHASELTDMFNESTPILFDRYTTTIRVRGIMEGMNESLMDLLEPMVPKPTKIFFIDSDPELCVQRVVANNRNISYWEAGCRDAKYRGAYLSETDISSRFTSQDRTEGFLKHLHLMRQTYQRVLKRYDNVVFIDNGKGLDETVNQVLEHL